MKGLSEDMKKDTSSLKWDTRSVTERRKLGIFISTRCHTTYPMQRRCWTYFLPRQCSKHTDDPWTRAREIPEEIGPSETGKMSKLASISPALGI